MLAFQVSLWLQGLLSITVELMAPGLVMPGLGAPGLAMPGMAVLRWAVLGMAAPS